MFNQYAYQTGYGSPVSSMSDNELATNFTGSTLENENTLSGRFTVPWLTAAIDEVAKLTSLPKNWDSYGGKPAGAFRASRSLAMINSLVKENTPKPIIIPTNSGAIQFEWHENGIDLEVEFKSLGIAEVYYEKIDNPDSLWEGEMKFDFRRLTEFIDQLSSDR